jgi:hypothetical protein
MAGNSKVHTPTIEESQTASASYEKEVSGKPIGSRRTEKSSAEAGVQTRVTESEATQPGVI